MTKKEFKKMIKFLKDRASLGYFICRSIDLFISGSHTDTEPRIFFNELFIISNDPSWSWIATEHLRPRYRTLKNIKLVRYRMIDIFEEICLDTEIYKDW